MITEKELGETNGPKDQITVLYTTGITFESRAELEIFAQGSTTGAAACRRWIERNPR